ncbi:MAG: hypothetical protein GXZ14_00845 [Ruminococcaceae bacterium]|nr:hypothetical protein [Oscillospiraceae bacterium]
MSKSNGNVRIKFTLPELSPAVRKSAQAFHTMNVQRRILKYLPYRSNGSVKDAVIRGTNTESGLITAGGNSKDGHHMAYLFYGVAMEGKPKRPTDRALNYTHTPNAQAGPFWDTALKTHEETELCGELKSHITKSLERKLK